MNESMKQVKKNKQKERARENVKRMFYMPTWSVTSIRERSHSHIQRGGLGEAHPEQSSESSEQKLIQ